MLLPVLGSGWRVSDCWNGGVDLKVLLGFSWQIAISFSPVFVVFFPLSVDMYRGDLDSRRKIIPGNFAVGIEPKTLEGAHKREEADLGDQIWQGLVLPVAKKHPVVVAGEGAHSGPKWIKAERSQPLQQSLKSCLPG
jgi:hypothetical protein